MALLVLVSLIVWQYDLRYLQRRKVTGDKKKFLEESTCDVALVLEVIVSTSFCRQTVFYRKSILEF